MQLWSIILITWDVSPEIFSIGPLTIRYYSLLFAVSFLTGIQIMTWIYRKEGRNENEINDLSIYVILGVVIGARLGHCLFYNPGFYLSNPLEILKVWEGGLASHGAAIGVLLSLLLFKKKNPKFKIMWLLDRIVIPTALGGSFIRLGNLFNSEIYGMPTDLPWGFVFVNSTAAGNIPRHPAQIYESLAYLLIFGLLLYLYLKKSGDFKEGFLFGLFLILVFVFRFFVEFIKADQSAFEAGWILNMGQILSIPLILLGLYFLIFWKKNKPETAK